MGTFPAALVISPDGRHVYTPGPPVPPGILVFDRDGETGLLGDSRGASGSAIQLRPPYWPRLVTAIAMSPDGKNVYATDRDTYSLKVFSRDVDSGVLSASTEQVFQDNDAGIVEPNLGGFVVRRMEGATVVDGLKHAHGVAVSQDGRNVYVAGWSDRSIACFERDGTSGSLEHQNTIQEPRGRAVYGLSFPYQITLSRDASFLYVACNGQDLSIFRRAPQTGALTWMQDFRDGRDEVEGLIGACRVAVARNGRSIFVAGGGVTVGGGAIVEFVRDSPGDKFRYVGAIKASEHPECGLRGISWLEVSPDGRHLYATSTEKSVTVFAVRSSGEDNAQADKE